MIRRCFALILAPWLLSGCLYHVRENTDAKVSDLAAHPFDLAPSQVTDPAAPTRSAPTKDKEGDPKAPSAAAKGPQLDIQTTAYMESVAEQRPDVNVRLKIPDSVPGAETEAIKKMPLNPEERRAEIKKLYPELPPLPEEPVPLPGPDGHPYTLACLQQLAAENSPVLRQVASDVLAAKGNLIQAAAYPNPTVGPEFDASNDNSTAGAWGGFIDQVIKTAGKLRLQTAAARKALEIAELTLRRARSDLSTQVRNAYYGLLVAKETVRVNKGLSQFTDEVYRVQVNLLDNGFGAPYEPAGLRAQVYTARLAYVQAIATYVYAWKTLVTTIGLRQLPLSEVAGRIDALIPYYNYDTLAAHVATHHTDTLIAKTGIAMAQYNLKFAQVTPIPDVDVHVGVVKDYALLPKGTYVYSTLGFPLPIWDQNKGNIMAAEGALVRATEQCHTAEQNLMNNLATAFTGYKTNLDGLEYYRKYILPDQVRVYKGIFERRFIDQAVGFTDLVSAQQTLAADVSTYLTILSGLWTSVVSVADLLQTDDLFQLGKPLMLEPLPDLEHLPPLPCCHGCAAGHCAADNCAAGHCAAGHTGADPGPTHNVPSPPAVSEVHAFTTSWQAAASGGKAAWRAPASLPDQLLEPPPPPPGGKTASGGSTP